MSMPGFARGLFVLLCCASAAGAAPERWQLRSAAPVVAGNHARSVSVALESGSLRANIERIAAQNGWEHVVWDLKNDYHWVGAVRITAGSLQGIMAQALANYPVQAVFYQGNHVLLIQPRTLR